LPSRHALARALDHSKTVNSEVATVEDLLSVRALDEDGISLAHVQEDAREQLSTGFREEASDGHLD